MDKEDVVYLHILTHTHTMEYYSVTQKSEIMLCAAIWMDLETILLSSTYSSQTKTNAMGYHLCVLWAQSRRSYCDPLDCRPPGSSVHGIFQAIV